MQRMTSIKRKNYENVKQLKVCLYKRKEYLKTLEKYYIVDIGMRYMLLGTQKIDAGHILENVVYLELLRRGNKVFVGKVDLLKWILLRKILKVSNTIKLH